MKKALFSIVSLLGDACCAGPALKKWAELHQDHTIELRMQDQNFMRILDGLTFVNKTLFPKIDFELVRYPLDRDKYDFFHNFNLPHAANIAWKSNVHMSFGYGTRLGVKIDEPIPILSPIIPKPYLDGKYVAAVPFAGSARIVTDDFGGERRLGYRLWNQIAEYIRNTLHVPVVFFGFSESPWDDFKQFVTTKCVIASVESVKDTLGHIIDDNCIGFLAQDSGILHCMSGAANQSDRKKLPTLAFMSSAVPFNVAYPYGLTNKGLIVQHDFCGTLTMRDINNNLVSFVESIAND